MNRLLCGRKGLREFFYDLSSHIAKLDVLALGPLNKCSERVVGAAAVEHPKYTLRVVELSELGRLSG